MHLGIVTLTSSVLTLRVTLIYPVIINTYQFLFLLGLGFTAD